MKAYKLFRQKSTGELTPLFINKTQVLLTGVEYKAEAHRTKGFAYRPGWHCTKEPNAPHLKMNLASGEVRVWKEVKITGYEEYSRPESQGGTWFLAKTMKIIG